MTTFYTSLNLLQQKAIDDLIERSGGFNAALKHFGWYGGTIHQVRDETIRRLECTDIAIGKDGVLYDMTKLTIGDKTYHAKVTA